MASPRRLRVHVAEGVAASRGPLLDLLRRTPGMSVTAVSSAYEPARANIAARQPDLILLDARLPGSRDLQIAWDRRGEVPLVIVIADDEHDALPAFEVGALHYLLRPVGERQLTSALERARSWFEMHAYAQLGRRVRDVQSSDASQPAERLVVSNGGRTVSVGTAAIDWIEAEGNYVRIHAGPDTHLLRSSIGALEARLRSAGFARIHRSRLVNLAHVQEIHQRPDGGGALVMPDGSHVRYSRSSSHLVAAHAAVARSTTGSFPRDDERAPTRVHPA